MFSVRLSFSDKLSILKKNPRAKIGLFFLVPGLLFLAISLPFFDSQSIRFFLEDSIYVDGKITYARVDSEAVDEAIVYAYNFSYTFNGKEYLGQSLSAVEYVPNQKVDIEVLSNQPDIARMADAEAPFTALDFGTMALILIVAGTVLILTGRGELGRIKKVLKDGSTTKGKQIEIKQIKAKKDERAVYNVFYRYTAHHKEYDTSIRTSYLEETKNVEKIIYSNRDHSKAVLVSQLPTDLIKKLSL